MLAAQPLDHLDIPPLQSASGVVHLPGSKSISNRVLLLAGLAQGQTAIQGLLQADDTKVMLDALQQLGCQVERQGPETLITGLGGGLPVRQAKLYMGNAGTAMRPLTAALAFMAMRHGGSFELHGVARMHERPIGDLVDALRQLGCGIDELGHPGFPPLRVHGDGAKPFKLGEPIRVRGDVSSQFLTSLLLASPLAARDEPVVFEVTGELISKPYIDITLKLLARFGVAVQREGWLRFTVPRGSSYQTPGRIAVEGDASAASYFIGMGALAASAAPLRVEGMGAQAMQGDVQFVDAARAMGADIKVEANALEVRRGAWPLKAVDLDCNHIPDAAMTLAVMALFADGTTRLRNIASWRVKETDRIAAMATELQKLGATVQTGHDFITITPPTGPEAWRLAAIDTYDDHRMAMCFSLAAFNPAAKAVRIRDPGCVAKTYPGYFQDFFGLVHATPEHLPVITIDGPTASGKGTVASAVASKLGFHRLDSGALYRATALAALNSGLDLGDAAAMGELAKTLNLKFWGALIWLDGHEVSAELRREDVGAAASRISAFPEVRQALHGLQLAFRQAPGLVADGRDMGTVVFPTAALKVFLTASAAQRAERRHKQLISKGISANIDSLRADLESRDARDKNRSVSPLKPAVDAQLLDNSSQSVDESVATVLNWWAQRSPFAKL